QHAQVALAVGLARHPELLILDEPVARLDPLARHDFMAALMTAVAEDNISVLLSSHVIAELERVCDYLVVLSHGRVQVAGDVADLVDSHRVVTGPTAEADAISESLTVVGEQRTRRQTRLLVRADRHTDWQIALPQSWQASPTGLEELVLSYLRAPDVTALPGPQLASAAGRRP
ncbi:MAG: ABC transporter ATP-binding protein, partial [Micromonosporaceae bacterium]|nr:ABC transporter ATP-binding protein [Micromonosporaceae bacterium]